MKLWIFLIPAIAFGHWQEELKEKIKRAPPRWMAEQIAEDLLRVTPQDLTHLNQVMSESTELVRYRIQGGEVKDEYHPTLIGHPRVKDMRVSFEALLQCTPLPDLDFVIAIGDAADNKDLSAPVFAFAKSLLHQKKIILIPDFEALQHSESALNDVEKGNKRHPWNKKKASAFWRGACTGGAFTLDTFTHFPRSELVTLSLSHPKWIDARFTLPVTQSDDPVAIKNKYGAYFGKSSPIKNHLQYKYQILIDGNTCAFARAYWQLFSNSVIFKQDSPNIQWYYRALQPGIHFIPFGAVSDLLLKFEWAKKNDKEAEKISQNAQKFANENLKKSDVYYYLYLLLTEYSKKQRC